MAETLSIAKTNDLAPGESKLIEVEGHRIALFNVEGDFLAVSETCAHRAGPLSEGTVREGTIICPWHGAKYDLRTGEVLRGPAREGIDCYVVRVEGDEIKVEVP